MSRKLNQNITRREDHAAPSRWPGVAMMVALLMLGLFIYKDYGVSWDEVAMREIGEVNLQFMRTGNDSLMQHFANKDHGASFEVPLRWIEDVTQVKDFGAIIAQRHLCSYLFYLLGIWCGYL